MKEKLNKTEINLVSVMQLRTSTEEEYPDDCRPLHFSSKSKFLWSSITEQQVLSCHG